MKKRRPKSYENLPEEVLTFAFQDSPLPFLKCGRGGRFVQFNARLLGGPQADIQSDFGIHAFFGS